MVLKNNSIPKNKLTYPSDLFRQFRKSGITKENKELQKTSRKMTNSLSLRQCHLPGQSSFLFSKCFSRFPQSLKDQKDTFFIPVHAITIPQYPTHSKFRSSFDYHFLTRFRWASAASGAASTHSRVYALLPPIRMLSINAYQF